MLNANIQEQGKTNHSILFRSLKTEKLFFNHEVVVSFMALKQDAILLISF